MSSLLAVSVPCLGLAWLSFQSQPPTDLGIVNNQLKPCPDSPNCVCTTATDDGHAIAPISFQGAAEDALLRLKLVLNETPRVKIVAATGNYLHAEFTSLVFRYVDDVEFLVDSEAGVIHFRSASRIGYSDLGANRKRMEQFRKDFEKATP